MKPPKDPTPSSEDQKQKFISSIDKIDLARLSIQLYKMREFRKLMVAGEFEVADDLYISTVMDSMLQSDLKEFHGDVIKHANKVLGIERGKQKTKQANKIKSWLYPLLAECEAEFPPERVNRGWSTMRNMAVKKLTKENLDDPRKELLTRSRIQVWIDEGRPNIRPT